MPYRIVPCRFVDGERYRLLVDRETSIPLWYPNLYITTQVRNASKSVATMDSRLRAIKVLLDYCDDMGIDLEERVRSGQLFSLWQLDGLRDFCQRNFDAEDEKQVRRKIAGKILSFRARAPARVSKTYEYQRLTYIADYLAWYAGALHEGRLLPAAAREVKNMVQLIHDRRPPLKPSATQRDKALQDSQFDLLMEIMEPDHPKNPFKAKDIAVRNALIIHLLAGLGIRRGELLGIRIQDINLRAREITIHRRPDEVTDPRLREPNTKTLARTIEFKSELAHRIREYIVDIRKNIKQAKRHDYLLVVHVHGPHRGKPINTSGLGKIFDTIRQAIPEFSKGIHPHAMRHTFNWRLSRAWDNLPEDKKPSLAAQEQARNHLNGWRQGSGTAAAYNHRYIEQEARKAGLLLQEQMHKPRRESREMNETSAVRRFYVNRRIETSLAGREFDPAEDLWALSKDKTLNLRHALCRLAEPLRGPYRTVMAQFRVPPLAVVLCHLAFVPHSVCAPVGYEPFHNGCLTQLPSEI